MLIALTIGVLGRRRRRPLRRRRGPHADADHRPLPLLAPAAAPAAHRLPVPRLAEEDRWARRPGIFILIVAVIGGLRWMPVARLVRAQFLSLREKEFVEAARGLGAPPVPPGGPPHPAQRAGPGDRGRHHRRGGRHHRRVVAVVPRASASRPTSPRGAGSSSTPRTTSTSPRTGRSSRARRSSSPCSPSTTSVTGCATPSIRERCSATRVTVRRAVLHARHRPGSADPPPQGLPARGDAGRAGPDRAR